MLMPLHLPGLLLSPAKLITEEPMRPARLESCAAAILGEHSASLDATLRKGVAIGIRGLTINRDVHDGDGPHVAAIPRSKQPG